MSLACAQTPFDAQVEEILSTVLLPGMMLTPAMPAVSNEVWAVLKTMPYTTRYRLYVQLRVRLCSEGLRLTCNMLTLASAELSTPEVSVMDC